MELSWKADQPQPTASVVKLLVALDLMDSSGVPSGSEATAVHNMLAASDDSIASRLWEQDGGPEIVRRQAAKLGLVHTSPPSDAGQWGSTLMSPSDVVTIYRYIARERPRLRHRGDGKRPAQRRRRFRPALRDSACVPGRELGGEAGRADPTADGCSTPRAWSEPRRGP